ncbi:MAG: CPBP family intramembrane metalloprotease [Lachnospiraceae bacterium]|nr:CPBP family intramembrane metalloprotease [Lachnospiraceae bacterium]
MMGKVKGLKRESGKWHDILPVAIVWAIMIGWLVFIIGYTPPEIAIMRLFSDKEEVVEFLEFYFSFIKVWIILIPIFFIRYNRPMLGQLVLTKGGNTVKGALTGLLLGFGTNGACILFSVLAGDIKLSYNSFDPGLLLLFFVVIFIQCGAEEIIDRLYLYQKLRRRYRLPVIAIAGSTAAFVMNHLFTPNFTLLSAGLIALYGVLLALFVYYYDCFWAAMMFHTAWNYSQSIIFGLPNSGEESYYSIYTMDVESAENGFFYDTAFGVEGSVGALVICAVVIAIIIGINHGQGEKKDLWK